jgi:hypothetical protein
MMSRRLDRYATVASNTRAIKTSMKTSLSSSLDSYPTSKRPSCLKNIVTVAYPSGTDSTAIKNRTALGVSTSSHIKLLLLQRGLPITMASTPGARPIATSNLRAIVRLYATRQANGEHVWWYGCINPVQPYPTYHLNAPLLSPVYSAGWNTITASRAISIGAPIISPIITALRRFAMFGRTAKTWENCYGDGMLIYPGTVTTSPARFRPCALKTSKSAQEDYEYLYLFNQYIDTYNSTYSKSLSSATLLSRYYTNLFSGVQTLHLR